MTSLDISSVRDFSKPRLRKMLIDFYRFIANPIGPPDPQRIELDTDYDKLIALTNKHLFKELNGKEHYTFARQSFEMPNAFIYVKLLNASKFTKKVGDYLIEFRVIKKRPKELPLKSVSTPAARNVFKVKSKTDLRWPKVNQPAIFKAKTTPKEHIKFSRIGMDKVKALERKIRYGFDRRTHSEQSRRLSREIFQQQQPQASSTVLSRTSAVLFGVPPNWTYCNSYELELSKTLDPTDLFLEIDVRLIEFLDINPKQAKIGKQIRQSCLGLRRRDRRSDGFLMTHKTSINFINHILIFFPAKTTA